MEHQLSSRFIDVYDRSLLSELFNNGHRPLDDESWLEVFAEMSKSQATFILADFTAAENLIERAGDVITYRQGLFASVRELVDACASHRWNGTIYEAWVWETARRVHTLLRNLDATSARALKLYSQHLGYYEIDTGSMQDALHEARLGLEGDLYWEVDVA